MCCVRGMCFRFENGYRNTSLYGNDNKNDYIGWYRYLPAGSFLQQ